MSGKELIALALIAVGLFGTTVAVSFSRRLRDAAFFALAFGVVMSTSMDINFFTKEWYRGTTRGIEFSFVDILSLSLLASMVLFPTKGHRRFYWPASFGFILLFLAYCGVSVAMAQPKLFGVFELSKLFRALVCFFVAAFYVQGERELRCALWAIVCAAAFEGLLALKQRYVDGVYRVGGTLDHPNSLSTYLLLTGPILIAVVNSALPKALRWAAAAAAACVFLGEVLTASRMGIPAFGLVMFSVTVACVSWRITAKKVAITLLVVVGAAGALYKAWDIIGSRFEEASTEEEYADTGKENRGHYLRLAKAIVKDKFFGIGLNNWSYWVSKKYGPELGFTYEDYDDIPPSMLSSDLEFDWAYKYAPPAHNLAAITAGELGIPGITLFGLMWLRWFSMGLLFLWPRVPDPLRRIPVGVFFGLCGVFLQSITEWVFRQTGIILSVFLVMGILAALCRVRRDARATERALDDDASESDWSPAPSSRTQRTAWDGASRP